MKKLLLALLILGALSIRHAHADNPLGNPIALGQTTTTESSHVFKASAGYLYGLSATTSGSAGYVMVTNTTTAATNGAINPFLCYGVGANSSLIVPFPYPVPFTTGITALFSTTGCNTLTLSATAFFQAQVK